MGIQFDITFILMIITGLVSFSAFSNKRLEEDLIFYGPAIQRGQWYRFITHGFIHGDVFHLAFNLLAFHSFGHWLERTFVDLFGSMGKIYYLLLYLLGMIVASLPDYLRHRDNFYFRSLGASGAVSAVVFAFILFNPKAPLGLLFIPFVHIPAMFFAIIYLAVSFYLDRRGGGNINHSAHIWGGLFGLLFTILLCQFFAPEGFNIYEHFLRELRY